MEKGIAYKTVYKVNARGVEQFTDGLTVEEPLEIQLVYGPKTLRTKTQVAVTMRTPGNDYQLACGFLFSENIITSPLAIQKIAHAYDASNSQEGNHIVLVLKNELDHQPVLHDRFTIANSSCGLCGKTSALNALDTSHLKKLSSHTFTLPRELITLLPDRLRTQQLIFKYTGGIHAAAAFSLQGKLEAIYEDIGRHNAVDKLIGHYFLEEQLKTENKILVVSSRASYEIIAKAIKARFPIVICVGAPSTLAVNLAENFGIILVGFVSQKSYNIYTHLDRLCFEEKSIS